MGSIHVPDLKEIVSGQDRERDLADLKKAVKAGTIDTVLVCGIDMWGRLFGKRFHAAFFVNGGHEETHCCDYLLTVDQDMLFVEVPAARTNLQRGDLVVEFVFLAGFVLE